MNEYDSLTDEECLALIADEVTEHMIEIGFARVENNGEVHYAFGSVNACWEIQKELMKERFGRDWTTPQERYPNMFFD